MIILLQTTTITRCSQIGLLFRKNIVFSLLICLTINIIIKISGIKAVVDAEEDTLFKSKQTFVKNDDSCEQQVTLRHTLDHAIQKHLNDKRNKNLLEWIDFETLNS